MKLDFKHWLVEECRSNFYRNFTFDGKTTLSDLKWIAENHPRSVLGDAFYLEIQDEILSRCFLETNKQPAGGRWIYGKIVKPVGELKAGDDVGVSKPREGTWEVVHLDTNKRAFVAEKELASYVKSVRDGNAPVMADTIEALRAVAASHRTPAAPQQAAPQKQQQTAGSAKGKKWIYAKMKEDLEGLKKGEDVGVVEADNGAWEMWSFDGQRMAATTKSDLPNVVQSVKKEDGTSVYFASSLEELHSLVEDKLTKTGEADQDKKKHVLEHEKLSPEQQAIDARFEKMISGTGQDHMMINALAGSGKTTMLKHLAWKYGKPGERWLYLVFNTKNKVEAQEKFPTTWVDVRTTNGFLGNLLKSNENVSRIDQTERLIEVLNKKRNKASEDDDDENNNSPMPRSKMGEIVDGPQFNEVLKKVGIVEDKDADAVIEKMPLGEYSTTAAKSCAHSIRYLFKEVAQKVADLAKAYGVDPRKDRSHIKAELEKLFKGYDLDTGLSEVKERIRKYRSSSMVTEVLAALKKVYGYDFMAKNFKDEVAECAEWLLKASLPKGTTQTLNFKGFDYDLGSLRDFSDDIWFAAINAHDMHWPHYDVVLADEVQDFNPCQKLMLEKLHGAGAKIVAVGDPNQAIYRFRGADGDAFHSLGRTLKELSGDKDTEHTLTTNYRSRKGILDHVNSMGHVTGLKHSESKYPGGGGGEVTNQDKEYGEIFTTLKQEHQESKKPGGKKMPETAFIARTNEPLVQAALKMLGDGVPFIIVGRDVSNELMRHINKVLKTAKMKDDSPAIPHPRAGSRPNLGAKLEEFQKKENERFSSMNSKKAYLQEMNATSEALYSALAAFSGMSRDVEDMDDKAHDAMMRAVAAKPMPTIKDFKKWLKARLGGFDVQDNEADLKAFNDRVKKEHPVVLTTAHKSKGLEFARVYILRDDQFPHPRATKEADKLQEENARYVAYTRAMDQLHIVKLKGQPGYRDPGGEE